MLEKGFGVTFWRLYYHLVWTTKDREPLIQPHMERRLFAYIVRKAAEMDVYTYAINGWYDHVHMVVAIAPRYSVADVVKLIKGASSYDVNHTYGLDYTFAWQRGYGALSLGEKQKPVAIRYVEHQKEHHQQHTTNTWLERATEDDEGPDDVGGMPEFVPPAIHEQSIRYTVDDEFPF